VRIISVKTDHDREFGNAVVTISGLPDTKDHVLVSFHRPGYQDNYLSTDGWQASECWFSIEPNVESNSGHFKFLLSPDLAQHMEPEAYEFSVRIAGKEYQHSYPWPDVLEPEEESISAKPIMPVPDKIEQVESKEPSIEPTMGTNTHGNESDTEPAGEQLDTPGSPGPSADSTKPNNEIPAPKKVSPLPEKTTPNKHHTTEDRDPSIKTETSKAPLVLIALVILALAIVVYLVLSFSDDSATTKENLPPKVTPDNIVVRKLSTEINVLTNDTDPEGSALTILEISEQPSQASAHITANNLIAYQANGGANNSDHFEYIVSDGTHKVTGQVEVRYALIQNSKPTPKKPNPIQKPNTSKAPTPQNQNTNPTLKAMNDRVQVKRGELNVINVLANDSGHKLRITQLSNSDIGFVSHDDQEIKFTWFADKSGEEVLFYDIEDTHGQKDSAKLVIQLRE